MTVALWPDYARIVQDGYRIAFRTDVRRIEYDDGMVRQFRASPDVQRVRNFELWVEGDADRVRFEGWVAKMGATGTFLLADIPEGYQRECRIVGGRGGVRWIAMLMRDDRKWWRAALTVEGDNDSVQGPIFAENVGDQNWLRDEAITPLVLPASSTASAGLAYSLTPALPAGVVLDAATRTLRGTPTVVQRPVEYTWRATDGDGIADSVRFNIGVGVSIWNETAAALGDASHIYIRHGRNTPATDTVNTPSAQYPNRRALVIQPMKLSDRGIRIPTWMLSDPSRITYLRRAYWEIIVQAAPSDTNQIRIISEVSPYTRGSTRTTGAEVSRDQGLAWILRFDAQNYYYGPGLMNDTDQYGDKFFGIGYVVDDDAIVEFLRLYTLAAGAGHRIDIAVVWVGQASAIDPYHAVTYLDGTRPVIPDPG